MLNRSSKHNKYVLFFQISSLQVEVRCVTPKMNLRFVYKHIHLVCTHYCPSFNILCSLLMNYRDRKWNNMHGHKDELADHEDTENRSEKSDSTITKSIESCSSNNVANSSRPTELGSRVRSHTHFSS